MTDFRMRLIIETILKDEKLLKQLKKDLEGIEPSAKKGSSGLKGFTDKISAMKGQILAGTAILVGFGIALKKAFDFSKEGAEVITLTNSFNRFLELADAAPDLLQQLKDAAHGTIPEFEMMSSTMTLVMGTTGELREELLEATPRLMEMAKASNKLNPALGTTTFLYESLARGIKRSAPLILDNLGVVIKVGEAYQTFADKMGLSVDGLSAVQKSQAVLAAALKAGVPLIEQAGGTTEAYADSWSKLTTHVINSKNAFLSWLAEGAKPVIQALDVIFFHNVDLEEGISKATLAVLNGSLAYDEYLKILENVQEGTKSSIFITDTLFVSQADYTALLERTSLEYVNQMQIFPKLTEEEVNRAQGLNELTEKQDRINQAMENAKADELADDVARLAAEEEQAKQHAEDLTQAIIDANTAFAKAREEFSKDPFSGLSTNLVSDIETFLDTKKFADAGGAALTAFKDAVLLAIFEEKITEEQGAVLLENVLVAAQQLEIDLGNIDFDAAVKALTEKGVTDAEEKLKIPVDLTQLEKDLATAETQTRAAIRVIEQIYGENSDLVESKLAELFGGFATTATEIRSTIAEEFGLAEEDIANLGKSFDEMTIRAGLSEEQIKDIQKAIDALTDKTVVITIVQEGDVDTGSGTDSAHGFNQTIPPGYPNDSYFLPLNVQSGEVVTVTPQGRTPATGTGQAGDIHVNAPVYVNSEANLSLEEMVNAAIPRHNV